MADGASSSRGDRVLVVDDEPAITVALARKLRRDGYTCLTAGSGEEALGRLADGDLDLILTDVRMPGMSGIELLKEAKRRDPDVQVVVMTAYAEVSFAVEALRHDADDYLLKPFDLLELSHCVSRALEHRRLIRENRDYREVVAASDRPEKSERFCIDGVRTLAQAIESRDRFTDRHLDRVAGVAIATAAELEVDGESLWTAWLGAILHDVGKISVDESILNKPGPLLPEERSEIERHPEVGVRIVDGVWPLERARGAILHHHERWDGAGYPEGLRGEAISLEGRIVAVADAYDAMTNDRPYRKAKDEESAIAELRAEAAGQFDPRVVEAFLRAHGKGFSWPDRYF